MNPLDLIKSLAKFIDPPDDATHQRRWRISMALLMIFGFGHVLWACGYGRKIGIYGFVKNDEFSDALTSIKTELHVIDGKLDAHESKLISIDNQSLQTNLFQAYRAQCKAGKNGYISRQIEQLQAQYQTKNNGVAWPVPDCNNILD